VAMPRLSNSAAAARVLQTGKFGEHRPQCLPEWGESLSDIARTYGVAHTTIARLWSTAVLLNDGDKPNAGRRAQCGWRRTRLSSGTAR